MSYDITWLIQIIITLMFYLTTLFLDDYMLQNQISFTFFTLCVTILGYKQNTMDANNPIINTCYCKTLLN